MEGDLRPSVPATALVVALWLAAALVRSGDARVHLDDAAHYLVLSEALAEGKGLRYVNEPGAPESDVLPFGYPALLALLRLAGVAWPHLWVAGVALGAAWLWTVMRRFHGAFPPGLCVPLALLAALGQPHDNALNVLSDVPAAALLLWGLAAASRHGETGGRRPLVIAAACLLAAAWTRPAALLGTLAAASWLALGAPRRSRRGALLLLAAAAAGWGAWECRESCRGGNGGPSGGMYLRDLAAVDDPLRPEAGGLGPGRIVRRVRNHLLVDLPVWITRLAWVARHDAPPPPPPPWASFAFSGLALAGFLRRMRGKRTVVEHFTALTVLLLLIWHNVQPRHLLPIAPFLLGYAAEGMLMATGALGAPFLASPCARLPATLFPAALCAAAWASATAGLLWRLSVPEPPNPAGEGFVRAARWVGARSAPGDVVLGMHLPSAHLYGGLKGVWFPRHWATRRTTDLASPEARAARWALLREGDLDSAAAREAILADGAWREALILGGTAVYERVR